MRKASATVGLLVLSFIPAPSFSHGNEKYSACELSRIVSGTYGGKAANAIFYCWDPNDPDVGIGIGGIPDMEPMAMPDEPMAMPEGPPMAMPDEPMAMPEGPPMEMPVLPTKRPEVPMEMPVLPTKRPEVPMGIPSMEPMEMPSMEPTEMPSMEPMEMPDIDLMLPADMSPAGSTCTPGTPQFCDF